jgi:E3 SUMO-protein ligase PIAS1
MHLPILKLRQKILNNYRCRRICIIKESDELASVMVLMISVKNACKFGWFLNKLESKELLTITREIGKIYCTLRNVISNRPSTCYSAMVSTITESFYPNMN